ncbi:hypothetical protein GCM10022631_21190 [Deinococcus rubellus]|uniref:Uncharacterized protein n=1 Tax=Deinococcus rubellus TaxID=1889240 RepID=A0ABY5YH55_9DEIO|nr:hypothetical protein [Deinococcus rubellus]UWX64460.1 hypothetical protein N0D28_01970 [Deinococcus rubellus]
MTDPLDDNTPLVGITEDDSRPAPTDQNTLLGRLVHPQPVDDAATRRGDVPSLATSFIETLSGQSVDGAGHADADADEGTTDNSQA